MLTFERYKEHLFTKCGYVRHSSGLKLHKAYMSYCSFQRHLHEKYGVN